MSDNVIYVDFSRNQGEADYIVRHALEDLDLKNQPEEFIERLKEYANQLWHAQCDECDIYDTIVVILRPEFSEHYDEVINIFAQNFN